MGKKYLQIHEMLLTDDALNCSCVFLRTIQIANFFFVMWCILPMKSSDFVNQQAFQRQKISNCRPRRLLSFERAMGVIGSQGDERAMGVIGFQVDGRSRENRSPDPCDVRLTYR